ncbi:peptidase T [bacterium]|nr:peptidase T [bacterium]
MQAELLDRFFRYVKIDTQSQEGVEDRYPSTEKQKDLSRLLVGELKALGLEDAQMDGHGLVMATLPGNLPEEDLKEIPVIGFLAHVDTSPEVSGKDVKPCVHKNYQGTDIDLPGDEKQVIRVSENPGLLNHIGDDIVTSDGTTLLGADDKAGIAEIMTMIATLKKNPSIQHGTLRIGFTPDEETGNGTAYFDVLDFGADFAYTVDGSTVGEIENETFNADAAVFRVEGINVHPGYAKDKLVNAIRVLGEILVELNQDPAPENTEDRQGYLHPYVIEGGVEEATLKILIRDFEKTGMDEKAQRLRVIQQTVQDKYPKARVHLEIKESYKNMKIKLDEDPRVVEYALEAVRRTGLEPRLQLIRGGTDGARLCFMNLLTPNIFAGGQNFHSRQEWVSVQAMEKAVETLVNLVQIWKEKAADR